MSRSNPFMILDDLDDGGTAALLRAGRATRDAIRGRLGSPREPDATRLAAASEPYWWDTPEDAAFLDHHISARRRLGPAYVGGLMILGPAGSGKSMSVVNACERLELRLTVIDCATTTDPQKWFGRREVDERGTRYEPSDLVLAVQRGDVVLLDDVSRIHPTIANPIFGWLDARQAVHLSDLNVMVEVHPETVFVATMNEGAQFGGTHRLDWAWRERFPFTIQRTFPPPVDEVKVLVSHTGCDEDGASNLVSLAGTARDMHRTGDLRFPLSTRTLVAAAWLMAAGYDEATALRRTALGLYDADTSGLASTASDRAKFERLLEGRFGPA